MLFPKPGKKTDKRKRHVSQYKTARSAFLSRNPWCQVGMTCTVEKPDPWGTLRQYPGTASEVHHVQGRGENYLDEGTWLATCHECHMYIHAHPSWAYENGFMEKRNKE